MNSIDKRLKRLRGERQNFALKAETLEGKVMTMRHFATRAAAEDHPVTLSLWKRVWIEELPPPKPAGVAALPPTPWTVDVVDGGYGGKTNFTYIRDANGRRIMSLLGRPGEKEKIAEFICSASRHVLNEGESVPVHANGE